jgi:hypothetical protein
MAGDKVSRRAEGGSWSCAHESLVWFLALLYLNLDSSVVTCETQQPHMTSSSTQM